MQGTVSTWYGRPFSAGMAAFAGISVYYGRLVVQRTRAGITAMTSMAAYTMAGMNCDVQCFVLHCTNLWQQGLVLESLLLQGAMAYIAP